MKIIIGHTGFVGRNVCKREKFDLYFNSKNISQYRKILNNINEEKELFLSCLPAEKWKINKYPHEDFDNLMEIYNIIKDFKYEKVTLISTIDVYENNTIHDNENSKIITNISPTYSSNRFLFEMLITSNLNFGGLKIFRIPSVFGDLLKKNIIFDLLNDNNLSSVNINTEFQWYYIDNLISDINTLSKKYPNERVFNIFTPPIKTEDIVNNYFKDKKNKLYYGEFKGYDYKTKYSDTGYFYSEIMVLNDLKKYITSETLNK